MLGSSVGSLKLQATQLCAAVFTVGVGEMVFLLLDDIQYHTDSRVVLDICRVLAEDFISTSAIE